jgi:hypothetical protein
MVGVGWTFANYLFSFNIIFLSDGLMAAAERGHVLRIYTAASGCYSALMDVRRAAKLV